MWIDKMNEKAKKMTGWDVASLKMAVLFFAFILVKVWPGLLTIPYWVLIALTVLFSLKPCHAVWIKK